MDSDVPSENDEFVLNAENEILERISTSKPPAEPVPDLIIPNTDSDTSIDTLEDEYSNNDDKNKTNFNISIHLNIKTSKKNVSIAAGNMATVVSEPVIKVLPGPQSTNRSGTSSIHSGWNTGQVQNKYSASAYARKARRVKFYRNGDRFYSGVTLPVSAERYKTFTALLEDITRLFEEQIKLPAAILTIFNMQGQRVHSMDDLEDRQNYVCGCKNEIFRKVDYVKASRWPKFFILAKASNCFLRIPQRNGCGDAGGDTIRSSAEISNDLKSVKPRLVTLIRNGIKPRKIVRLLLNKRNSASFEHVLTAITNVVRLDSGYARKIYTFNGKHVLKLADFFNEEDVFFVYGTERVNPITDFQLDAEESKVIQNYHKAQNLTTKARNPIKFRKLKNSRRETVSDCEVDRARIPAAIHERYVVSRVIGDGHFAIVLKIKDRQNGNPYALKIVEKNKLRGKEYHIYAEVRVMKKLSHPNIVELIMDIDTRTNMYLVLEYVSGCDLFDAVHRYKHFTESQCRDIMKFLASAMAHIHSKNIVHRDIKLENLLVTLDKKGNLIRFKLADFSLACEMTKPLMDFCGTPMYLAPEIVNEIGYGMKVDVWAAGVVLYILLCGFPPFVSNGEKHDSLYEAITTANYDFPEPEWTQVTDDAKCLIINMMQIEPHLRLSSEDVMDHPWTNPNVKDCDRDSVTDSDENTQRSSENCFRMQRENTISKMLLENDENKKVATVIDQDDKEQVEVKVDDVVVVDELNLTLALEKTVYEKKCSKKTDRKKNTKNYKKNYKKSSRKDNKSFAKSCAKKDEKKATKKVDKKGKKTKKKTNKTDDKTDNKKDDRKDDRNDDDGTDNKRNDETEDRTEDKNEDKTDDSKNDEREEKSDNVPDNNYDYDRQIDDNNNDRDESRNNDENDRMNDVENDGKYDGNYGNKDIENDVKNYDETDKKNDAKNDAENETKNDVEIDNKNDAKNNVENGPQNDVEKHEKNDGKNNVVPDDKNNVENKVRNNEQREVKNNDQYNKYIYINYGKKKITNDIKPFGINNVGYYKDDKKKKQKKDTKIVKNNNTKIPKKAGKNNDKKADGKFDNEDNIKCEMCVCKDEKGIANNDTEEDDEIEAKKYAIDYDMKTHLLDNAKDYLLYIEKEILYRAEVKNDINENMNNLQENDEDFAQVFDDMQDDKKDEEANKNENKYNEDIKEAGTDKNEVKEVDDAELLKQLLIEENQIAQRGDINKGLSLVRCRTLPAILCNERERAIERRPSIFDIDVNFYCFNTDFDDDLEMLRPIVTSRSDNMHYKLERSNLKYILKDIDFIGSEIDHKFHKELLSTSDESSASMSDTEDASFKIEEIN